ncbi:MAG: arsenate reductase ArsC [Gemmatimonadales bacterium]
MSVRRILFLCTGNSARSQIAEALVTHKGSGRFTAASAGSKPASQVHPRAVEVLRQAGIEWIGREPKGLDAVAAASWDIVITVCDRAKESCPIFPGQPATAHWGMEDPAEVEGTEEVKLRAFTRTRQLLARRIDLLLALPIEKLDRLSLERRLRAIPAESDTR